MSNNNNKQDELQNSLVKLADIMETYHPKSKEYNYYAAQYRKVVKALYPDEHTRKPQLRTPSNKTIQALTPCTCGSKTFVYKKNDQGASITCKNCPRTSGINKSNKQCRIAWNLTF